jgi:5-methylcytosine-specific restriction endonuclease McrA
MGKEISVKKREVVYNKFKGKCAYCGNPLLYKNMDVDHIVPKHRGSTHSEIRAYGLEKGTNDIENLNPSCKSCNSSKSTFTVSNWKKQLELKHDRLLRDNASYRILNRFGAIKYNNNITFHFEIHNR